MDHCKPTRRVIIRHGHDLQLHAPPIDADVVQLIHVGAVVHPDDLHRPLLVINRGVGPNGTGPRRLGLLLAAESDGLSSAGHPLVGLLQTYVPQLL